jgi:hypothetical protein
MSDTFDGGYDSAPGASTPESPTGQQDPSQAQQSPSGASTGEPGQAQPPEGYIPRHRFQEVIEARRQWEQSARQFYEQNQQLQRELQEIRRQSQGPAQPADENAKRIREQIFELVPELKQVVEQLIPRADALQQAAESAPAVQELQRQIYDNLGAQAVRTLDAAINDTFKGIQLSNDDRRFIHVAFIDYLDQVPEARQRYMSGDMSIASEWWAQRRKSMFDPFRRQGVMAPREQAARVARLPRTGPATQTLGTGGPPKPKTEDELHDAAFDALMARMNQQG